VHTTHKTGAFAATLIIVSVAAAATAVNLAVSASANYVLRFINTVTYLRKLEL
jgi:hypothetical protein